MKTIRTGVIKEKCRDEGFKLLNEVENFFLDIEWTEPDEGTRDGLLVFVLKTRLGLVDPVS